MHTTTNVHDIIEIKYAFPASLDTIDNMPGI